MKKPFLFFVVILASLYLTSCIQTPDPDTPKRISILFNVGETGNTIAVEGDTIEVDEIKLLADRFNLVLPDSVVLQTSVDALVMTYRSEFGGEDETILSANIGYEDVDQFQGMQIFINPPQENDNIQDSDFFGESTNYSFIMRGRYNSQTFEYYSNTEFDNYYKFENLIELDNKEETLIIRLNLNISDIVIDETSNSLVNPGNPDNKAKIDSLLQTHISVEAFSGDVF